MRFIILVAAWLSFCSPALAVEGPAAAGPIGGTDIHSAVLPGSGLYGGAIGLWAGTTRFVDGNGNTPPALATGQIVKEVSSPFLLYVPSFQVFGGSIGISAAIPGANKCGHLFAGDGDRCTAGIGDAYAELDWSRSFGKLRPSTYPGAARILGGLSILVGLGAVIPTGQYDASDPTEKALSLSGNVWDVAPSVALTYTTAPLLAEGTEFSAKLFWNNYFTNPATQYKQGDVLNLDFAVTEHIGRFQVGLAGFYLLQCADDKIASVVVPPDGKRAELLQFGGIVNYDMPDSKSALKLKASTSLFARNSVEAWSVVLAWGKKF